MELKDQVAVVTGGVLEPSDAAADPDRWLAGMARLQARILGGIDHAPVPDLGQG